MFKIIKPTKQVLSKLKNSYENYEYEIDDKNKKYTFESTLLKVTIDLKIEEVLFEKSLAKLHFSIWSDYLKYTNKTYLTSNAIGSDEVGVGDYFGPIVVCAVNLADQDKEIVELLKFTDSKLIKDEYIWSNVPVLLNLLDINQTSVKILLPSQYNKLIDTKHNAHEIKALVHGMAIETLIEKNKDKKFNNIIVDAFCERVHLTKYLNKLASEKLIKNNFHITKWETKAEIKYLDVAVASVIARFYFLMELKKISKWAGIEIPKGATEINKIYQASKYIYTKHGIENLKKAVKWHFKTTKSLDFINE